MQISGNQCDGMVTLKSDRSKCADRPDDQLGLCPYPQLFRS
ncbi:hypothetical protein [Streptomyces sp. SYSU K217416]